jgi:hypothetical protein
LSTSLIDFNRMRAILTFGTIYALAIFIWALIEYVLGLQGPYIRYHEIYSYFFAIPAVMILYRAFRAHSLQQKVELRWTEQLKYGLGIVFVATALTPLVWWIFCEWINPQFLPALRQYHVVARKLPAVQVSELFTLPNFLFMQVVTTAVVGSLIALILSVIGHNQKNTSQALS